MFISGIGLFSGNVWARRMGVVIAGLGGIIPFAWMPIIRFGESCSWRSRCPLFGRRRRMEKTSPRPKISLIGPVLMYMSSRRSIERRTLRQSAELNETEHG